MRRFTVKFLVLFAAIAALYVYYLFMLPQYTGDLGVLGHIPFGKEEGDDLFADVMRKDTTAYFRYAEHDEILPDSALIVIGDSFSELGTCGFANFVGQFSMQPVIVLGRVDFSSPEQDFVSLVNDNYFKSGQTVIVESVERDVYGRLSRLDYKTRHNTVRIVPYRENACRADMYRIEKFVAWIRMAVGIKVPVKKFHLSRPFFSHHRYDATLYVYQDDLNFKHQNPKTQWTTLPEHLIRLHDFAARHGINLLYLVAADRYDCYEPYIVEQHARNAMLDYVNELPFVINSKVVLQDSLSNGIKDLYKVNNTHWSDKGASIVAREIVKHL